MDSSTLTTIVNATLAVLAALSFGLQYRRENRSELQKDYERKRDMLNECETEKTRLRQRVFALEQFITQNELSVPNEAN